MKDPSTMSSSELLDKFATLSNPAPRSVARTQSLGDVEDEILRRLDGPPSAEVEIDRLRKALDEATRDRDAHKAAVREALDDCDELRERWIHVRASRDRLASFVRLLAEEGVPVEPANLLYDPAEPVSPEDSPHALRFKARKALGRSDLYGRKTGGSL